MKKTRYVAAIAVVVACTSVVSCAPAPAAPQQPTAIVLRAVDGDTIDVRDDLKGPLRIRVLGVDAPELHRPGWSVGCGAAAAADYADKMLTGQRVALVSDLTQDVHDRYGRTLAYVERGSWNFSVEAVRAGMARAYVYENRPVELSAAIEAAQEDAKSAMRGIWGPPCNGHVDSVKLAELA